MAYIGEIQIIHDLYKKGVPVKKIAEKINRSQAFVTQYVRAIDCYEKGKALPESKLYSMKSFVKWAVASSGGNNPEEPEEPKEPVKPDCDENPEEQEAQKPDQDTRVINSYEAVAIQAAVTIGETAKAAINGLLALVGVRN